MTATQLQEDHLLYSAIYQARLLAQVDVRSKRVKVANMLLVTYLVVDQVIKREEHAHDATSAEAQDRPLKRLRANLCQPHGWIDTKQMNGAVIIPS